MEGKFSSTELSAIFKGVTKDKKPPVIIKCEECGTELVRKKNWQRFCSDVCRSRWHANWQARRIAELEAKLDGKVNHEA